MGKSRNGNLFLFKPREKGERGTLFLSFLLVNWDFVRGMEERREGPLKLSFAFAFSRRNRGKKGSGGEKVE